MTKKTDDKVTKAGTVELEEKDLDSVQGGGTEELFGAYNFKVEIEGVKPRLTTDEVGIRAGIRATDRLGVRATKGTKIRK
ncbi:hypothetical protein [Parasphingopyxis marina]|uniref:Uncharacterized protein n=1 Tax=Parasphingopyxis marina TaxID=2761622 RepID=A0A842HXB7_9SPHN|nr:hypothetical protein [Parasphingopyxis marina]MBC2777067.1 hypothetical protein [Parasphingopyxis marina]